MIKHTTLLLLIGSTLSLQAQTTFLFQDSNSAIGSALDGQSSGSFTVDTIEITATASVDTFNSTTSGFGTNQSDSGDDTDAFDFTDGGSGLTEGFTLSFDRDVTLIDFSVSSFGVSDEVTISDGATTVATITSTGTTSLGNYALSSASTLNVNTTAGTYGNGWSFDSISVVPEPGTYALMAGCFSLSLAILKRRQK